MEAEKRKNPRGLFERPPGSGVWWINYYEKGKQRREKVGSKAKAISLYQVRKAAITEGRKLPKLRASKALLFGDLIDDVLTYTANHKDSRSYVSKAEIVRPKFGNIEASEMTVKDLEKWLVKHCKTAATWNRYRAFFSLCFRRGQIGNKELINVARNVDRKKEVNDRICKLTREEYVGLRDVISRRFPEHLAEFIVSVMTGMRLSEQYSLVWLQVHLDAHLIKLTNTKNGSQRDVHLNDAAVTAIRSVQRPEQRKTDEVFPRQGKTFDTRSWFHPCLEEAGISDYTWHGNRHTFCTWLAEKGATTLDIMNAAGHKSMAMAKRYMHPSQKHKRSVVDLISDGPTSEQALTHAPQIPGAA